VSLTWEKPRSDAGGRILGYFIEKKDANSDNWARINQVPTPATIFNIPNLIEEREYDFRVFAVNEAGESKPATTGRRILVKDPKGLHCFVFQSLTRSRFIFYLFVAFYFIIFKIYFLLISCFWLYLQ